MKKVSFIDSVVIKVKGGNGGDGGKYFHKEKYIEFGGPSGGNGGNGGSIFLVANINENTLLNYKNKKMFEGISGKRGSKNNMTGSSGENIYLKVPVGTEVIFREKKITDLTFNNQIWLASKGGKGGRGNASFKSSRNTTPSLFELGEKPKWKELVLNLKVLADVGLLGYPNVGKSTLLSTISNAKAKIANYPFTTIQPQLGVIKTNNGSFVMTDLPGLIEGASLNKGMGIQFLKHLSRTKIILHLIDPYDGEWKQKYIKLRNELKKYSKYLYSLSEIIVISKSELLDREMEEIIKKDFKEEIYFISSKTNIGLKKLIFVIEKKLSELKEKEQEELNNLNKDDFMYIKYEKEKNQDDWTYEHINDIWILKGNFVEYWAERIPLDSFENFLRIVNKLKSKGIISFLKKKGLKKGDIIEIQNSGFTLEWE